MCCGMRSTYGKPNSGGELGPPPPHGDQIQRRSSPSLSQESGEKKKKDIGTNKALAAYRSHCQLYPSTTREPTASYPYPFLLKKTSTNTITMPTLERPVAPGLPDDMAAKAYFDMLRQTSRLSIPDFVRIPAASALSFAAGMSIGLAHGSKMAV